MQASTGDGWGDIVRQLWAESNPYAPCSSLSLSPSSSSSISFSCLSLCPPSSSLLFAPPVGLSLASSLSRALSALYSLLCFLSCLVSLYPAFFVSLAQSLCALCVLQLFELACLTPHTLTLLRPWLPWRSVSFMFVRTARPAT